MSDNAGDLARAIREMSDEEVQEALAYGESLGVGRMLRDAQQACARVAVQSVAPGRVVGPAALLDSPSLSAPRAEWLAWHEQLLAMNQGDAAVRFALQRARAVLG